MSEPTEPATGKVEPPCAECGHEADEHHNGKDCLWDTVETAGGDLVICKCTRYQPKPTSTDPDAHLSGDDYLKAKQERFKSSGWAKEATDLDAARAFLNGRKGYINGPIANFELLPDDLEERVQQAIQIGGSGNYEVIGELAKRFPQAVFIRKGTDRTFPANMVRAAYEENIEMRPDKALEAK